MSSDDLRILPWKEISEHNRLPDLPESLAKITDDKLRERSRTAYRLALRAAYVCRLWKPNIHIDVLLACFKVPEPIEDVSDDLISNVDRFFGDLRPMVVGLKRVGVAAWHFRQAPDSACRVLKHILSELEVGSGREQNQSVIDLFHKADEEIASLREDLESLMRLLQIHPDLVFDEQTVQPEGTKDQDEPDEPSVEGWSFGCREFAHGPKTYPLSGKRLTVLRCLVLARGKPFTTKELWDKVWGAKQRIIRNTLKSTISHLRKTLCGMGLKHVAEAIRCKDKSYSLVLPDPNSKL